MPNNDTKPPSLIERVLASAAHKHLERMRLADLAKPRMPEGWDGPVYADDEFHHSIGDMLDDYSCQGDIELPEYVFPCEEKTLSDLDTGANLADVLLEYLTHAHGLDPERDHFTPPAKVLQRWIDSQTGTLYFPSMTHVIVIVEVLLEQLLPSMDDASLDAFALREFRRHAACGDTDPSRCLDGLLQSLKRDPHGQAGELASFIVGARDEARELMRHCIEFQHQLVSSRGGEGR